MWMDLGLNTVSVAGGFCIFLRIPDVFYGNKPLSPGKFEHRLAYNVTGLISSVPTNQKAKYILTTMNVKLLAASVLLVQSGAFYWTVLISSWRTDCKL